MLIMVLGAFLFHFALKNFFPKFFLIFPLFFPLSKNIGVKHPLVEEFSGLSLGKGECKRMDLLSVEGVIQI